MIAVSYEEFEQEVKRQFAEQWPTLSENEVSSYIKSDEAQDEIRRAFETPRLPSYDRNLTREEWILGPAASVSYCLALMY